MIKKLVLCALLLSNVTFAADLDDYIYDAVDTELADCPDLNREEIFYISRFILQQGSQKGLVGAVGKEVGKAVIGAVVGEVVHRAIEHRENRTPTPRATPTPRPAPETHHRSDPPPAACPSVN